MIHTQCCIFCLCLCLCLFFVISRARNQLTSISIWQVKDLDKLYPIVSAVDRDFSTAGYDHFVCMSVRACVRACVRERQRRERNFVDNVMPVFTLSYLLPLIIN